MFRLTALIAAPVGLATLLLTMASTAEAGRGDLGTTTSVVPVTTLVASDDDVNTFGVSVGAGGAGGGETGGGESAGGSDGDGGSGPRCVWRWASGSAPVVVPGEVGSGPAVRRDHPVTHQPQALQELLCEVTTAGVVSWRQVGTRWADLREVRKTDLIVGFYDRLVGRLGDPVSLINPPEVGFVNLGLWLAVEDVGPVVEQGPVGPYVVSMTASLAETSFVFDDGVEVWSVVCEGAGVPIVDLDVVEEGPCGFTFDRPSPVGEPVVVSIVSRWEIVYETSLGGGTMPDLTTETAFDYVVKEVQTVGGYGP